MAYALITGASKGIGRAIAEQLAGKKQDLLLVARSEQLLREASEELMQKYAVTVKYLVCDLSQHGAVAIVSEWCVTNQFEVNILVNNAGYGLSGPCDRFSVASNMNMLQLNMLALTELTLVMLPQLKARQQAYILNIASTAAYQAIPGLSLYAASKSFVLQFSRGLSHELKRSSVSVTCISPGATDTEFIVRAQVGQKGLKAADKVNMLPEAVAKIAVNAMFGKKAEVVTGGLNKLGVFMAWLLPKSIVEQVAGSIYR